MATQVIDETLLAQLLLQCTFVLKPEERKDLTCFSCRKLTLDPYQTHCGCIYCEECLNKKFQNGNRYCNGKKKECKDQKILIDKNVFMSAFVKTQIMQLEVYCPYELCNNIAKLSNISEHMRICIKQPQNCPFSEMGCVNDDITKDLMLKHLNDNSFLHSELLVTMIKSMRNEIDQNRLEISYLKEELANIKSISVDMVVPFDEANFERRNKKKAKVNPNIPTFSPYFYTHTNGYKMRLKVFPKGLGDCLGSHLSVFIVISKGVYDDLLQWPCNHVANISIVNQTSGQAHLNKTISYSTASKSRKEAYDKPIEEDNKEDGYSSFISYRELEATPDLIVKDSILLRCIISPPP